MLPNHFTELPWLLNNIFTPSTLQPVQKYLRPSSPFCPKGPQDGNSATAQQHIGSRASGIQHQVIKAATRSNHLARLSVNQSGSFKVHRVVAMFCE